VKIDIAPRILNWISDECGWSVSSLCFFTPEKMSQYPLDGRLVGRQKESANLQTRNGTGLKAELFKSNISLNKNRKKKVLQFGTLFSECILCAFAFLFIIYVHLIQIEICL
jgi:hypothetical protein